MDKIWLNSYPAAMPAHIDLAAYQSIAQQIDTNCHVYAQQIAYSSMGTTLSYAQLLQQAQQLAAYFQQTLGLGVGSHVALMLPNILQYPVSLFACLLAGITVINVNPLYTPHELEHQLADSRAECIIVLANMAATLAEVLPRLPTLKTVIITQFGDLLPYPKSMVVNAMLKYVKKMMPAYEIPCAVTWRQVKQDGRGLIFNPPKLTPDTIAFLQYTGGTTGRAKGAVLTHGNILANMQQIHAWFAQMMIGHNLCVLTPLPLYHIFSLTCNCLAFMQFGVHNVLIANPRDLTALAKEFNRYPIVAMTAVNTLFNGILHHKARDIMDFSHLKLAVGGGMPVQKSVADAWQTLTGVPILQGYGLTEASPVLTVDSPEISQFTGKIGLPMPSTDISLRDDEGREVALGEPGELFARGPQVMQGYWQQPEETAKVLSTDGWLATGDIAVMDAQGFLTIVDRKKDMILVSGFNVYPTEIEEVISQCPGVVEVAVIGIPDEASGEKVKAIVVRNSESLTQQRILDFCHTQLTRYKVPRVVEFRDSLPKSNVGKILRRELR